MARPSSQTVWKRSKKPFSSGNEMGLYQAMGGYHLSAYGRTGFMDRRGMHSEWKRFRASERPAK
jgi:hypothetical protein